MHSPKSTPRIAAFAACAILAPFFTACGESGRSPTDPPAPTPPSSTTTASFVGEMTVVSVSGQGACSSYRPGETVGSAHWGLGYTADSFSLDFELGNHWYNGSLQGRSFAAEFLSPHSQLAAPCDYNASISGTFAEDFSSFEAHEVLTLGVFGPPENQIKVELRWRAVRR